MNVNYNTGDPMAETKGIAVITGGTGGIGLATAEIFSYENWKVYCLSRKQPLEGVLPERGEFIPCDVTKLNDLEKAFKHIYEREGRIDVLISNAGFGISGSMEFTTEADARRNVDVNFFGGFFATKGVLPYMRKGGKGRIVFTSSLAAVMPIPFQGFYSCTKAGLNLMAGSLDNEVKSFGVRVSVVMPGDVSTGFTAAREKSFIGDEVYGEAVSRSISIMENDEANGMKPEAIGRVIYKAATAKRHRPVYIPGFQYKLFYLLRRLLPTSFAYWLIGKVYLGNGK